MKYWNYPAVGQGFNSYSWDNGSIYVTLSRNFASSTYDWANMPSSVSASSTQTQKDAVAKLCADVGVAFSMEYGCSGSGAVTSYAPNVFINYFKYQSTATWVNRSSYANASAWMQVFKAEVQAGRPSQLRIQDPSAGGHSVVVDGYRDSPSETVHINMGWSGSYDGWYTPDSFTTGYYHWISTSYQGAAIGIQPPPSPSQIENMAASGSELFGDFGASGIWMWNGVLWTQLTTSNPENMVPSDPMLFGDFGIWGLHQWDGAEWTQLTPADPENMVISGSMLFGDFGIWGLYQWDGAKWTQLTPADPENMVISGSMLFGDFGIWGLYQWNGIEWAQLSGPIL
jgi:hypothetical protein